MRVLIGAIAGILLITVALAAYGKEEHDVFAVVVGLSGQPASQTGAPLILDGDEGHVAQNVEVGYARCEGGSLRNETVTIGWAAHLFRGDGGVVRYVVQASRLAHPEQLDLKTCFATPPELIAARWEGTAAPHPGEVVNLETRKGFEGTVDHLRDTAKPD
jgi:hypothetical protein